jgi:hypothetical protein
VILPFFIDLSITANNRDGIWYYANSSYAAFQWRTTDTNYPPQDGVDIYDYVLEYKTSHPGEYLFTYNVMGIFNTEAEIGLQTDNGSEFPSAINSGIEN